MQFGDLIEYNMRNFFTKKSYTKCGRKASPRPTKTKTMSVLIPLSQVVGFLSIICISLLEPCQFKSFFMHSYHDFLGRCFFLFPVISTSITLCIWELMSPRMTRPYHRRHLWIIVSSIFKQDPLYQEEPQSTPYQPVSPTDHTTFHPMQPRFIRNSKFPGFTTVQQNWSNKTLINLPLLLQR